VDAHPASSPPDQRHGWRLCHRCCMDLRQDVFARSAMPSPVAITAGLFAAAEVVLITLDER